MTLVIRQYGQAIVRKQVASRRRKLTATDVAWANQTATACYPPLVSGYFDIALCADDTGKDSSKDVDSEVLIA